MSCGHITILPNSKMGIRSDEEVPRIDKTVSWESPYNHFRDYIGILLVDFIHGRLIVNDPYYWTP